MHKTRLEAKAAGENKYMSGNPCKHGHLSPRYVNTGRCCECFSILQKKKTLNGTRKASDESRAKAGKKYRESEKGRKSRQDWIDRDPKWAWSVNARHGSRARAKLKELEFDLTSEYIYSITPDHCPIFGTPFVFSGAKRMTLESPSLDRIKNDQGYVRGNIAVISLKANNIKFVATSEEIQKVADWLRKQGY